MGKYLPIILAARLGSLNKAASLCGYAQPSMMYIINKLEDDLGVKLFYRSKRGVTLTEAGKKLLEVMEEIEAQEERLRGIAQSFQETRLRIGTFPDLPGRWISGLLAAIRKDSPDAMVRLEATVSHRQGLEDVKNGAFSCCFSILKDPPGVDCVPLYNDPYYLVLSAEHPLAQREQISLQEVLDQLPLIPNRESGDPDSPLWDLFQGKEHVLLADSTLPDPIFSVALAEKGLGAAMLPGLQLDEMSLRESVRVLPLADGPIRTLTLLCQPKEDRSPATDELVRLVSALVRGAEA